MKVSRPPKGWDGDDLAGALGTVRKKGRPGDDPESFGHAKVHHRSQANWPCNRTVFTYVVLEKDSARLALLGGLCRAWQKEGEGTVAGGMRNGNLWERRIWGSSWRK